MLISLQTNKTSLEAAGNLSHIARCYGRANNSLINLQLAEFTEAVKKQAMPTQALLDVANHLVVEFNHKYADQTPFQLVATTAGATLVLAYIYKQLTSKVRWLKIGLIEPYSSGFLSSIHCCTDSRNLSFGWLGSYHISKAELRKRFRV